MFVNFLLFSPPGRLLFFKFYLSLSSFYSADSAVATTSDCILFCADGSTHYHLYCLFSVVCPCSGHGWGGPRSSTFSAAGGRRRCRCLFHLNASLRLSSLFAAHRVSDEFPSPRQEEPMKFKWIARCWSSSGYRRAVKFGLRRIVSGSHVFPQLPRHGQHFFFWITIRVPAQRETDGRYLDIRYSGQVAVRLLVPVARLESELIDCPFLAPLNAMRAAWGERVVTTCFHWSTVSFIIIMTTTIITNYKRKRVVRTSRRQSCDEYRIRAS